MNITLGLDIGINSIGWAIIDNNTHNIMNNDVATYPAPVSNAKANSRIYYRSKRRSLSRAFNSIKNSKHVDRKIFIEIILVFYIVFMCSLSILNRDNWQVWFNIAMSLFVTILTLLYQDRK